EVRVARLADVAIEKVAGQGVSGGDVSTASNAMVRYKGAASALEVHFSDLSEIRANFEEKYRAHYGFALDRQAIVVESIAVEAFGPLRKDSDSPSVLVAPPGQVKPRSYAELYVRSTPTRVPVFRFEEIGLEAKIVGPAIIVDELATTIIEDGWTAAMHRSGGLVLTSDGTERMRGKVDAAVDPYLLELFN